MPKGLLSGLDFAEKTGQRLLPDSLQKAATRGV
jgi:hypothetical protein